jgi:hypothetical protein
LRSPSPGDQGPERGAANSEERLARHQAGEELVTGQAGNPVDLEALASAVEQCDPGLGVIGAEGGQGAQVASAHACGVLDLQCPEAARAVDHEVDFAARALAQLACGETARCPAELRVAQRLYNEIGAAGYAERLAEELGEVVAEGRHHH